MADEYILPFDVIQYGVSLDGYVQSVIDNYGELMESTRTNTGLGMSSLSMDMSSVRHARTIKFVNASKSAKA